MTAEGAGSTRPRRVAERVREEVASLLAHDVKDPGVAGAVLTRVEMGADLRVAHVHVRLLDDSGDGARRRALVAALRRASGMLRREVTRRLGLRYAPELRFEYDEGADAQTRIEQLLTEIAEEKRR
jgi:ribosome-binding factor A